MRVLARWLITAAGHLGRSVWRSGQESVSYQLTRLGAEAGFKSWVGRGRLSLNDWKVKKKNTSALYYSNSETALNRGGEFQLSVLIGSLTRSGIKMGRGIKKSCGVCTHMCEGRKGREIRKGVKGSLGGRMFRSRPRLRKLVTPDLKAPKIAVRLGGPLQPSSSREQAVSSLPRLCFIHFKE